MVRLGTECLSFFKRSIVKLNSGLLFCFSEAGEVRWRRLILDAVRLDASWEAPATLFDQDVIPRFDGSRNKLLNSMV